MIVTISPHYPSDTSNPICATVSSSPFFVLVDLPPIVLPPITVTITEIPNPAVGASGLTLSGCNILNLNRSTIVKNRINPMMRNTVTSLNSFTVSWTNFYLPIQVFYNSTLLNNFKGSTMRISVNDIGSYTASQDIEIVNSNPNNHFHWRRQAEFVDGWYFKCVHIDETTLTATPFFFLYGENKPGGGTHSESFVLCSKAGAITLGPDMVPVPGSVPTTFDKQYWPFPVTRFSSNLFFGLHTVIGTDFIASDRGCKGTYSLGPGDQISWDLRFTKIHRHILTDYNPLEQFENAVQMATSNTGVYQHPSMPLFKFWEYAPLITAYAMNHNMNCFVTGTINWRGTTYNLSNEKGYQDENWGSGGFPHPYVWMQANNFKNATGTTDFPATSLIAVYTPEMPVGTTGLSTHVATICLRHNGNIYKFFMVDPNVFFSRYVALFPDILYDISDISCEVEFVKGGVHHTVDVSDVSNITSAIGSFPRSPSAKPIRWQLSSENDNGDRIQISVTCPESSIIELEAPLGGSMVADVTKESLHATFSVQITPDGGVPETIVSHFGTAEFGD